MESLKEILNKRKFSTNYYDEFSNQSDYVECEICDSARWIIVNKQTVPCSSCQQNNTDEAEINIKLMHAGLSQLLEYDLKKFQIDPKETLYIEDIAKNLSIAKKLGTTTVWLINEEQWGKKDSEKEFIDYKIKNVSLFLKEIRLLKSA